MEKKKRTVIVNGKIIDLDKAPIEDLKRAQKELERREKEIRKQIQGELDRD